MIVDNRDKERKREMIQQQLKELIEKYYGGSVTVSQDYTKNGRKNGFLLEYKSKPHVLVEHRQFWIEKFRNEEQLRNWICATVRLEIGDCESIFKGIKDLVEACEAFDYSMIKPTNKNLKTNKGITDEFVKKVASEKGYEIWKESGFTKVTFPNNPTVYKYRLNIFETAEKLGLISEEDCKERLFNDQRYVVNI